MKLTEINKDILWEGEIDGEQYMFTINEDGHALFERAGKVSGSIKKGLAFAGKAAMVGLAGAWAVDAIQKYRKNKRNTMTFFTKDQQEKKLYQSIVDDLMKTGNYKKVKQSYVDGGHLWVLKKKRI